LKKSGISIFVKILETLIERQHMIKEDLHCIFIHKLLCKVVRHTFDLILSTSVAMGLAWLEIAFRLVSLALSACLSYQLSTSQPGHKQNHGGVQALVSRGFSAVSSIGIDSLARLLLLIML
jgi:hypothetical protein